MPKKIYLVYDFEELCGVFSTFSKAKQAVHEHIFYIKKYTQDKAKKLNLGEADFEIYEDNGERRWIYALVAKSKNNGHDLHMRKIAIYEYEQDKYYSSIKHLVDQKKAK
ncbi:MAG: hypothetical protein QW275_03415 [Candidatus Anstonellaceae archaeon]